MRCLIIGLEFADEAAALLQQTLYEFSTCAFDQAVDRIAINRPDIVFLEFQPNLRLELLLQRIAALSCQEYAPILVGIAPHEADRVAFARYYNGGLEMIIERPLNGELLSAQLSAYTRKLGIEKNTVSSSHLLLDIASHDCFLKNTRGELLGHFKVPPMQFEALRLLIEHPRRIWQKDELGQHLSKDDGFDTRAIGTIISRLRERFSEILKPIEDHYIVTPYKYPFIHTEYGCGYYFLDCLQFRHEEATLSFSATRRKSLKALSARRRF